MNLGLRRMCHLRLSGSAAPRRTWTDWLSSVAPTRSCCGPPNRPQPSYHVVHAIGCFLFLQQALIRSRLSTWRLANPNGHRHDPRGVKRRVARERPWAGCHGRHLHRSWSSIPITSATWSGDILRSGWLFFFNPLSFIGIALDTKPTVEQYRSTMDGHAALARIPTMLETMFWTQGYFYYTQADVFPGIGWKTCAC